jgi:hypothetical protein
MNMTDSLDLLKVELTQNIVPQILDLLMTAVNKGQPVHEVENGLWDLALQVGRRALGVFLDCHGTGDLGPTVTLPDGRHIDRLDKLHARRYVSLFGAYALQRTAYGTREGQAIEFVPLDQRLQLPQSAFSYVLQDWDQALAMEEPFGQVSQTIERILKLKQSVDTLEGMSRQQAQDVGDFRDLQGSPPAAEEGQIVVVTADCKGIVIRGQGTKTVCGGMRPAGRRANQKRMAAVAAVYTVDPYVRTADDIVAALFRDPDYEPEARPSPCHKRVWASLPQEGPKPRSSIAMVFDWVWWEFAQRNPKLQRPTVCLCDGQEQLWEACAEGVMDPNRVDVLDLLHVTPRLWSAAKLLHGEKSKEVVPFVRERLTQVLEGKVLTALRSMRRVAQKRGLSGVKKKALGKICSYLYKNRQRMRYDEYLRAGYPIASGVIEGACRHLIKDRLERAGMHWTLAGAQALLDLRSVWIGGYWQEFQQDRIERETERLYCHRDLVAGEAFFAQAG